MFVDHFPASFELNTKCVLLSDDKVMLAGASPYTSFFNMVFKQDGSDVPLAFSTFPNNPVFAR